MITNLPFIVSFRDDKHPEVHQRQGDIKPQDAAHSKPFLSHATRRDIENRRLRDPADKEQTQGDVQREEGQRTKEVTSDRR